jgi:hypothetical protein
LVHQKQFLQYITFSLILFSKLISKVLESFNSYLKIPKAKDKIKIATKNICFLFSKSIEINFLNINNIIDIKIKKKEKVIPNFIKEDKKIADLKPATKII